MGLSGSMLWDPADLAPSLPSSVTRLKVARLSAASLSICWYWTLLLLLLLGRDVLLCWAVEDSLKFLIVSESGLFMDLVPLFLQWKILSIMKEEEKLETLARESRDAMEDTDMPRSLPLSCSWSFVFRATDLLSDEDSVPLPLFRVGDVTDAVLSCKVAVLC